MKAAIIKSCHTCPFSEDETERSGFLWLRRETVPYCSLGPARFACAPYEGEIYSDCPLPDVEIETVQSVTLRYKQ